MRKKRFIIKLLKFLGLRKKKQKILLHDSIRPRKVKSCYPCEWKNPIKRKLSTGEEITTLPIDNLINTHKALETWKKELL